MKKNFTGIIYEAFKDNELANQFAVTVISAAAGYCFAEYVLNLQSSAGIVNFMQNGLHRLDELVNVDAPKVAALMAGCFGFSVNGYINHERFKKADAPRISD